MIYALIIAALGIVIIALALFIAGAIGRNRRLNREKKTMQGELESALAGKEELKVQNTDLSVALEQTRLSFNTLLKERNELKARATALQEAMEARPTQPKRTVRKNNAQTTEQ